MRRGNKTALYLNIFAGAFPLFAILRVLTELWDAPASEYFYMVAQIGCSVNIMCWMLSVKKRIIHSETRRYLLMIGGSFLLYFFFQMTRYCLFVESITVRRYMWYSYYVPMAFIPVFGLFVILCFSLPENQRLKRGWKLLLIPAALLSAGFLTNDLHFLAFGFPNGIEWDAEGRTLGPVFYANWIFMAILISIAAREMKRVNSNVTRKSILWQPFLPLAAGIVYVVVFSFLPGLVKIGNIKLFEMAEIFGFMIIGFMEGCIYIGLIPSNTGYADLFSVTNIPSRIAGLKGETVFSSKSGADSVKEDEDHYVVSVPVTGGSLEYVVDLTNINSLNRQISKLTLALEARNEILHSENEIAAEREKSEVAIRIYDRISELVRPQSLEIQRLLADCAGEEGFRGNLARCAVLNAYIKRRSNMELEAQKNGTLPFAELATAMAESLEYIKLTGTETYLSYSGRGVLSAERICGIYRVFESAAEAVMGSASFLTVRLELDHDVMLIRFLASGSGKAPDLSDLVFDGYKIEYTLEENDLKLVIIEEGGEPL